jgi:hypothetical protein
MLLKIRDKPKVNRRGFQTAVMGLSWYNRAGVVKAEGKVYGAVRQRQ